MNYGKRFDPSSITNEQLIDELKKLAKRLGRTPSRKDMYSGGNEITRRLYLYKKRFGSFSNAELKARLKKNIGGVGLKYNKEDCKAMIVVKEFINLPIKGSNNFGMT